MAPTGGLSTGAGCQWVIACRGGRAKRRFRAVPGRNRKKFVRSLTSIAKWFGPNRADVRCSRLSPSGVRGEAPGRRPGAAAAPAAAPARSPTCSKAPPPSRITTTSPPPWSAPCRFVGPHRRSDASNATQRNAAPHPFRQPQTPVAPSHTGRSVGQLSPPYTRQSTTQPGTAGSHTQPSAHTAPSQLVRTQLPSMHS